MLPTKQRDEVNSQLSKSANGCVFLLWRWSACSKRRGLRFAVRMLPDYQRVKRGGDTMEYQNLSRDESETEIDETDISDADASPEKKEKIQKIIERAGGGISLLFHTPDDEAYADILVAGHRETWKIRSKTFKKFFRRECWQNGIALKAEELREAINLFEAQAQFDGPEIKVYLRVAAVHDQIWIDLCDRDWKAARIAPDDWRVVALPDV